MKVTDASRVSGAGGVIGLCLKALNDIDKRLNDLGRT